MSNKLGSSGYDKGDAGGAHGDYEHGVSSAWVRKRVESAKASPARLGNFEGNLRAHMKLKKGFGKHKKASTAVRAAQARGSKLKGDKGRAYTMAKSYSSQTD